MVAVVASVMVHPHREAAVEAAPLTTIPDVTSALLDSQQVAHVATYHALVPTLVARLRSPSIEKILLLPQAAGAGLPLRAALGAELVPAHAGHVVAAHLELDKAAAAVATRVLVLSGQVQEGSVLGRHGSSVQGSVLSAGEGRVRGATGAAEGQSARGARKEHLGTSGLRVQVDECAALTPRTVRKNRVTIKGK